MRLVLVEHGGERVCGDTAHFAARSAEWAENTFQRVSVSHLATIAARLLDESEGRFLWTYQYAPFGPRDGVGYDIFGVADQLEAEPEARFSHITEVVEKCFYFGFVRCARPAVPFIPARQTDREPGLDFWRETPRGGTGTDGL